MTELETLKQENAELKEKLADLQARYDGLLSIAKLATVNLCKILEDTTNEWSSLMKKAETLKK